MFQKKTYAAAISFSIDGSLLAALCADGVVRVFRMSTGKLIRSYDESMQVLFRFQINQTRIYFILIYFTIFQIFMIPIMTLSQSQSQTQNVSDVLHRTERP